MWQQTTTNWSIQLNIQQSFSIGVLLLTTGSSNIILLDTSGTFLTFLSTFKPVTCFSSGKEFFIFTTPAVANNGTATTATRNANGSRAGTWFDTPRICWFRDPGDAPFLATNR